MLRPARPLSRPRAGRAAGHLAGDGAAVVASRWVTTWRPAAAADAAPAPADLVAVRAAGAHRAQRRARRVLDHLELHVLLSASDSTVYARRPATAASATAERGESSETTTAEGRGRRTTAPSTSVAAARDSWGAGRCWGGAGSDRMSLERRGALPGGLPVPDALRLMCVHAHPDDESSKGAADDGALRRGGRRRARRHAHRRLARLRAQPGHGPPRGRRRTSPRCAPPRWSGPARSSACARSSSATSTAACPRATRCRRCPTAASPSATSRSRPARSSRWCAASGRTS